MTSVWSESILDNNYDILCHRVVREPIVSKKSTRFFEMLGMLILLYVTAGTYRIAGGLADGLSPAVITLCGTTALLLGIGLWVVLIRLLSWFLLLASGLVLALVEPTSSTGMICTIVGSTLLYLSGWFLPRPLWKLSVLGAAISGCEAVALLVHQQDAPTVLTQFFVTDLLLAYLATAYVGQVLAVRQTSRKPSELSLPSLTPRENEIIRLVADDQTSKEIAYNLGISSGTVRNSLSVIYKKLGVNDGRALYFDLMKRVE